MCSVAAPTLSSNRRNRVSLLSWLADGSALLYYSPQPITAQLTRWIAETAASAQLPPHPITPAQCCLQVALPTLSARQIMEAQLSCGRHLQLGVKPVSVSVTQMSEQEALAMYASTAHSAAEMEKHAWASDTLEKRRAIAAEFATMLARLPDSLSRTVYTAGPRDIVMFAERWRMTHTGSVLPSGEEIVAPSSFSGMLSHLATMFSLLNRRGKWQPVSRFGNPVLSAEVEFLKAGYRNYCLSNGYEVRTLRDPMSGATVCAAACTCPRSHLARIATGGFGNAALS